MLDEVEKNRFIVSRSQPHLTKLFMICTKMQPNFTMQFSKTTMGEEARKITIIRRG